MEAPRRPDEFGRHSVSETDSLAPPPPGFAQRRRALRQAIVQLADAPGDLELSIGAAQAAAALAEAGDGEGLASILRADPEAPTIAWTVACYEIGHLTPSTFRDLSDPCAAVNLVGACSDSSHVASELVVSTATGLQWTAMSRAGSSLRLTLPRPNEGMGLDEIAGETAWSAHHRWREELDRWRAQPESAYAPEPPPAQSSEVAAALERASALYTAELEAATTRHAAALAAIERRLSRIEDLLLASHTDLASCPPSTIFAAHRSD